MRLVQFHTGHPREVRVARVVGERLDVLDGAVSSYDLAMAAADSGGRLAELVEDARVAEQVPYSEVIAGRRLLPPLTHPDPAHLLVTGTGLTHLGSAAARDAMHQKLSSAEESLSDSMKMFKWGVAEGKPADGGPGGQPEWFFKGDGDCVTKPGHPFRMPSFAMDGGEEPEVVGLYVVASNGTPCRVGFALGNEFSDHVMERRNYLYLAHSKLRPCSFGPELRLGPLPHTVHGTSRIRRAGAVIWEKEFVSGEANMTHRIAGLEHHHFKYAAFRRPGDVHCHFFGTATLSFSDAVRVEEGDEFEIACDDFGAPLRNGLERDAPQTIEVRQL